MMILVSEEHHVFICFQKFLAFRLDECRRTISLDMSTFLIFCAILPLNQCREHEFAPFVMFELTKSSSNRRNARGQQRSEV